MSATVALTPRSTVGAPSRRAHPWLVLGVVAVAQLMLVVDATVVNIALPHAQAALGFSDADRQWVVTAYSLAFGSLLLVGGRLADTLGRKRVFLLGLAGFSAASALGGAAGSFTVLVAARALQGASGALLAPAALSVLTITFTESAARVRAFGLFGAISAAGGSIGLILGGTLTEYLNWRSVMYVNVVIAVIAAVLAVPLLASDGLREHRRIDVRGAVLAAVGVFTIVYGVSRTATGKSPSVLYPMTLMLVVAGALLLAAFAAVERRTVHPLLPLAIVRDRTRGGAVAAMFLSATGVFGILLFLTYYLQSTLGYSPVRTGLAFLPMGATMIVVGSAGNSALAPRVSARVTVPGGLLIAGVGMTLLTRIGVRPEYTSVVLPATLVTGVGLALIFAPCFNLGTTGVKESDAGIASATLQVAQQIGGSIGTAALNTVATAAAARYAAAHAAAVNASPLRAHADVHSFSIAFWITAATFFVAALVVAALLNPRVRVRSVPHAEQPPTHHRPPTAGRPARATELVPSRR